MNGRWIERIAYGCGLLAVCGIFMAILTRPAKPPDPGLLMATARADIVEVLTRAGIEPLKVQTNSVTEGPGDSMVVDVTVTPQPNQPPGYAYKVIVFLDEGWYVKDRCLVGQSCGGLEDARVG